MRKFLIGLIIGILVLPVSIWFYFRSGRVPVAAYAPMMPFEKQLSKMALNAKIDAEAPGKAPITADEANLTAGAKVYREQCSYCHGLPGQQLNAAGKGMFPKPTEMFVKKGVTDDPAGESYWKIANGIRLSGMPAFKGVLTEEQMWQVSLVLVNAHNLPPTATAALQSEPVAVGK